MSWFDNLIHAGVGFVEGLNRQNGRPARGGYASAPQSPFQSRMSAIAGTCGIPMQSTRETNASFRIPFGGRTYLCVAVHAGGEVCLAVYSQIEFPGGRMPPEVRHLVSLVSDELAEYTLDVLDDDGYSLVFAQGIIPVENLNARSFQYGVEQLLIIITKMDAHLIRNGYAR